MRALRVIVMEDEAIVGMFLVDVLVELGHDVCALEFTEDGGVAAARRCKPDLMIVDVHLGEGNGICAVNEITRFGFVPHVFVSGDTLDKQTLSPAAVVLQKPFLEPDLIRAIDRALALAAGFAWPTRDLPAKDCL